MIQRRPIPATRPVLLALFLLVIGMLPGVAAAQDDPQEGGTLTVGLSRAPTTFDPHVYDGATHAPLQGNVYNGLLRYGPDGDLVPDLASGYEMPDDTTLVFTLREGVTFHDGSAFTADDVVYSFERILDPDTGATQRGALDAALESVEAVDDHTVRLTLREPVASIVETLARPDVTMVSREFAESGVELRQEMMGTGPFQLDRYEPDVEYVLTRNEAYFKDGLPYLDELRFVPLADDGARVNALYTGEVDAIQYVPTQQMAFIEESPELQYWHGDAIFMGLFLNTQHEPLDDPLVRQAITLAVDRPGLIEAAFDGRGTAIGGGLIPSGTWAHNEDLTSTYERDLERARELLAEAGYEDGVTLPVLAASIAVHLRPAEVLQAQLAEAGIDVELEVVEVSVMIQRRNEGDYTSLVFGAALPMNDPDFYSNYFATGAPVSYAAPTGWSDPEMDRLLDEGRGTFDQEERREIYRAFEERLLEQVPIAFLNWREQGYAAHPDVRGFYFVPGVMGLISEIAYESTWLAR